MYLMVCFTSLDGGPIYQTVQDNTKQTLCTYSHALKWTRTRDLSVTMVQDLRCFSSFNNTDTNILSLNWIRHITETHLVHTRISFLYNGQTSVCTLYLLRYFEPRFDNFSLSPYSDYESQPESKLQNQFFIKEAISIHSAQSIVLLRAFTKAVKGMKDEWVTGVNFGHSRSKKA